MKCPCCGAEVELGLVAVAACAEETPVAVAEEAAAVAGVEAAEEPVAEAACEPPCEPCQTAAAPCCTEEVVAEAVAATCAEEDKPVVAEVAEAVAAA